MKGYRFPSYEKKGNILKQMIKDVRSYKSETGLAPNEPVKLILSPKMPFKGIEAYLTRFLFAKSVEEAAELPEGGRIYNYGGVSLFVEHEEDKGAAKARLDEEVAHLEAEVARGEKMLSNPGFLAKAPKEKIKLEQDKLSLNKQKLAEAKAQLAKLG